MTKNGIRLEKKIRFRSNSNFLFRFLYAFARYTIHIRNAFVNAAIFPDGV